MSALPLLTTQWLWIALAATTVILVAPSIRIIGPNEVGLVTKRFSFLVPTLRVGTQASPLRGATGKGRRAAKTSVPTQSVGTRYTEKKRRRGETRRIEVPG